MSANDEHSIEAIARALAHTLEAHEKKRKEEEHEEKQKAKEKEQLTTRISVAALALTVLMSFLGYARAERANVGAAATAAAAQAHAESEASWAYYQAKNEQRAAYRLADDELTRSVRGLPAGDGRVAMAVAHHTQYMDQIFEISNECRHLFSTIQDRNRTQILKRREAARISRHTDQYDMGTRILTLAVIVFSITLLANKPRMFWAGAGVAFFGALVAINGYFLFVG
jgi:hypothetical protein